MPDHSCCLILNKHYIFDLARKKCQNPVMVPLVQFQQIMDGDGCQIPATENLGDQNNVNSAKTRTVPARELVIDAHLKAERNSQFRDKLHFQ